MGVDVESVERWRRELPRLASGGPSRALFTEEEHAYCAGFADPAPRYAGRWCAKEAVLKALSRWVTLEPRQIEIVRGPGEAPEARVASDALPDARIVFRLSVSHSRDTAVAFAVAIRTSGR